MQRKVGKPARLYASSALIAVAAFMVFGVTTTQAQAVSDRVKVACSGDYKRFCNGYQVGSASLRNCMRSAGKNLSHVCVRALVDAGEVPRSVLSKLR
ncbi:MAG: hypothetical protein NW205_02830 [Hyphomicrobiaceae bacterium]|nr:hypothetical protein [Hyphomicrobiaceae bacterium]